MAIAGAGALQNTGLGVSTALTQNLGSFNALPVTNQFSSIVTQATGAINNTALSQLRTLGAGNFPAITNAIPSGFASSLGSVANGGFTGLIDSTAKTIMGNGDLGKFGQVFNASQAFVGQSNQFLGAVQNFTAIGQTFNPALGGMNTVITGGLNQVTSSFPSFGADLSKLGSLINLNNLPNLGDPSQLLSRITAVAGGELPSVSQILASGGVGSDTLTRITRGEIVGLTPDIEKQLYEGMTKITGPALDQVKIALRVSTPNINTMADLLNPEKILPNSYRSLQMPTPDGLERIYTNASSVNTGLERFLQDATAPEYTGDDPIIRARLGLPPLPVRT